MAQTDDGRNPTKRIKAGILEKQTDHLKSWNERYIVLEPFRLVYWKNKAEFLSKSPPRGTFDLRPGTAIIAGKYSTGRFVFSVVHPTLQLTFAAGSDAERNLWAQAFISATTVPTPAPAPAPAPATVNAAPRSDTRAESFSSVFVLSAPSESALTPAAVDPEPTADTPQDAAASVHDAEAAVVERITAPATADVSAVISTESAVAPPAIEPTPVAAPAEDAPPSQPENTVLLAPAIANSGESFSVALPGPTRSEPLAVNEASVQAPTAPAEQAVPAAPGFTPAPIPPGAVGAQLREKLAFLHRLADSTAEWVGPTISSGIKCYTSTDGTPSCRGDGIVPYPRKAMLALLLEISAKREMDPMFDRGHHVKTFDAQNNLTYLRFSGQFGVAPRDFCSISHWCIEQDGTLIVAAYSTEDPACPPVDGVVRAQLHIGGWVIRPRPGIYAAARSKPGFAPSAPPAHMDPAIDADGCDVTFLMKSDFKGTVPTFVVRMVAQGQSMQVLTSKDVLTKWFSKGGKLGPQRLAEFRRATVGNVAEESLFSNYLADLTSHAQRSSLSVRGSDSAVSRILEVAAPSAVVSAPTTVIAEAIEPVVVTKTAALPPAPGFTPAPIPPGAVGAQLREKLAFLHRLADSTAEWVGPTISSGIKCYTSTDGTPSCRGDGIVPYPRKAMLALLLEISAKREMDPMFDKGHHVKTFDEQNNLTYLRFSGQFGVAPRDFCSISHWCIEQDGTLIVAAYSTEDPACPPVNGIVRAQLHIGGWVIRPRPGISAAARSKPGFAPSAPPAHMDPAIDADGCDVTFLMKSDFKGTVPTFVVRMVAQGQSMQVLTSKDVLTKWFSKGGKLGPQRLAEFRRATVGNVAEEAAYAGYLTSLADVAQQASLTALPVVAAPPATTAVALAVEAQAASSSLAISAKPASAPAAPGFTPAPIPPGAVGAQLREKLAFLHRLADSTAEWVGPTISSGIKCYTSTDGTPSCRGDGIVPYPRKAMLALLLEISAKREMDPMFDKGHHVKTFDEQNNLTYLRFSGQFGVAPRDFCSISHWCIEQDGTLIVAAYSTEDPACPPVNGIVRAQLHIGGWVIRPRPGISAAARSKPGFAPSAPPAHMDPAIDADGCDVTFLMKSDFKGTVPTFVVRMVAQGQSMQVLTSKDVLTKWFSKGGKLGPQRLAEFRQATVGNVAEEAAYAGYLQSLRDFESESSRPSPALPTPAPPYAGEPDGLRHRSVHHAAAEQPAPAPSTQPLEALSAVPTAAAAPLSVGETLKGWLRDAGAPSGPRARVAILFIFVVAFLLPMALGVFGRLLALAGVW